MPLYVFRSGHRDSTLSLDGVVYHDGEEVTLTEAQAARLGTRAVLVPGTGTSGPGTGQVPEVPTPPVSTPPKRRGRPPKAKT